MNRVALGLLATVTAGQSAPKDGEFAARGIPFVRAGSLGDLLAGKPESELELVSDDIARLRKLKIFPAGTILFAKSGMSATKDRVYALRKPAYVVSHLAALIPSENVHGDYLRLALKHFPPSTLIKDPAYPSIGLDEIRGYEISTPEDRDDQIRIAHLLGKVEGLIARRKQQLAQLDALLKSVFLEMFGDPTLNPHGFKTRKLSEFYVSTHEGTKCGPFGSALKKDELVDSGIPVWNMDNIGADGNMVLPFRMWIAPAKYEQLSAYAVQDGDIIISRAGTVGKMCIARMDGQAAIISTNLIRLRLGKRLRSLHFTSLMLYCKGRVGRLKTGADGAFTHMNTGVLDSLEFPYPPVELQDKFAVIAGRVEALKTRYRQTLTDLETLYAALSQSAFKGELDLSRIPLPAIDLNPNPIEDGATMSAELELPTAFAFPDLGLPIEVLADEAGRLKLLGPWLQAWQDHLGAETFVAQDFLDAAQSRLEEIYPDSELALGMAAYEHIKHWVFESLGTNQLKQGFDEVSKRITLKTVRA